MLEADYVLCTFSVGVLQNDDVVFEPELPAWKEEAIQSMTMGTYTKIFFQFEHKFWFDGEVCFLVFPSTVPIADVYSKVGSVRRS